jgi:hypothetical protein
MPELHTAQDGVPFAGGRAFVLPCRLERFIPQHHA